LLLQKSGNANRLPGLIPYDNKHPYQAYSEIITAEALGMAGIFPEFPQIHMLEALIAGNPGFPCGLAVLT
jgi:hypothetical protein